MTFNDGLLSMKLVIKFFGHNIQVVKNYCLFMMKNFVAKNDICYSEVFSK